MKRLVIVVAAALATAFAWFGQASAAGALPTPGAPILAHTNEAPHLSTEHNNTVVGRGPPAVVYNYTQRPRAVDATSCGPSMRSGAEVSWTYNTYDHIVWFAQGDRLLICCDWLLGVVADGQTRRPRPATHPRRPGRHPRLPDAGHRVLH